MDWLTAMSVVALGMMTAILMGLAAGALVGASVAAGAAVAAGAEVGGTSVGAGVAGAPQAARITTNIAHMNRFLNFIFILLLEGRLGSRSVSWVGSVFLRSSAIEAHSI